MLALAHAGTAANAIVTAVTIVTQSRGPSHIRVLDGRCEGARRHGCMPCPAKLAQLRAGRSGRATRGRRPPDERRSARGV